jgi:SAM-dependent methyltransferase
MLLQEPRLQGVALGSAEWFTIQRDLIAEKPLLKHCYDAWYAALLRDEATVPADQPGILLELGSGGSYLAELRPDVITSDIVPGAASQVIDARHIPYPDNSVRAIFLTHALHHIPQVEAFFAEAQRVLVPGGVVAMIEVAHTPLARAFFSHMHPEPYDDRAHAWDFAQNDAMADANQALSWLVFVRDKQRFAVEFPGLQIEQFEYLPWFSYLASGGVTRRSVLPGPLARVALAADVLTRPLGGLVSLHWHIRLRKQL